MTASPPWALIDWQVPDPPSSQVWADHLRWLVAVMDHDDSDLAFIASLLSHALKFEGLTESQAAPANKILARVRRMWREDRLSAQRPSDEDSDEVSGALADLPAAGEA
jgi:hypothetical protein